MGHYITVADENFCASLAKRLGMSEILTQEAFLGEDPEECLRVVRWIENEEVRLRGEYGVIEGRRRYHPKRMLKSWARKNGKLGTQKREGSF